MYKAISLSISLIFSYSFIFGQAPGIEWARTYGGSNSDIPHSIFQTSDGGYIIGGTTWSNDSDITLQKGIYDYWVVKLNKDNSIQWQKSYGGTKEDALSSLLPTKDGGYILAGTTLSYSGDITQNKGGYDCWIVKLKSSGTIEWQKTYGGTGNEGASSIVQTSDGGYIVAGNTTSNDSDVMGNHSRNNDIWVLKLDNAGKKQWQKTLGGDSDEYAYNIIQTRDQGYLISGLTYSKDTKGDVKEMKGGYDVWIIKLNQAGKIEWQKSYGGTYGDFAVGASEMADSGYLVLAMGSYKGGDLIGIKGSADYWVLRLNKSGNIIWKKTYGGSEWDAPLSLIACKDSSYLLVGSTNSLDSDITVSYGYDDAWIVNINTSGAIQWQQSFGGSAFDFGYSGAETSDGGFIFTNLTNSKDNEVENPKGSYDIWTVKLKPLISAINNTEADSVLSAPTIFPNPTFGNISIGVSELENEKYAIHVSDMLGRICLDKTNLTGKNTFSLTENPPGVYLVRLETKNRIFEKKIILQ